MKPTYDSAAAAQILRDGIAKGYWTHEQLSRPTPGYRELKQEMSRHKVMELRNFQLPPYRNLLDD